MEQVGSRRATLVASLTEPPAAAALAGVADWLEVRADLVGDLDPARLRAGFPGKLLYTLRSRAEGGAFDGSPERRRRRLLEAAGRYDLVDLEAERDLTAEVLAALPPAARVVSWHGAAAAPDALQARFERMARVPAALYKLVPAAAQAGEELAPLFLLAALGRRDVAAFASGPLGLWTRVVAPRLGAPVVYGAAGAVPAAPGQPTLARLRADFGLPDLPPAAALFGVVGNPIAHSLSPRLHNAAYRALGVPALYVPFYAPSFGDFWLEVVESGALETLGLPLGGLSVTAPHKEAALGIAGAESPLAARIGAANTLVCRDGVWEAEATDPEGVLVPLGERGVDVAGRAAAVVGCGGAGRSAAIGLAAAGARVTLFNRGIERGLKAAAALGLPFRPLSELDPEEYDLLVHATPRGRGPGEAPPIDVERVRPGAVVLDMAYGEAPTPLLVAATARGALAIDGREVLLGQALAQFRMMTGREMPREVARQALGLPDVEAAEPRAAARVEERG